MAEQAAGPTTAGFDDLAVDRRALDALLARGLISTAARDHALGLIEPPRDWGLWAGRLIAVVGAALVLAGIVYFFAFNWAAIPPLAKLGGIALGIAAAIATAAVLGLDHAAAGYATSAATVLVGVFLAVFGQIYQSGADAWQLFAGWAGLTVVWALVAASSATGAVWSAVVAGARVLWGPALPRGPGAATGSEAMLVAVASAAFLAIREILVGRGVGWPAARWTRLYLATPMLVAAAWAAIEAIVVSSFSAEGRHVPTVVGLAIVVGGLAVYRWVLRDGRVLAGAVVALTMIVDIAFYNLLARAGRAFEIQFLFLCGLVTLALFAAAVAWLRAATRAMEREDG